MDNRLTSLTLTTTSLLTLRSDRDSIIALDILGGRGAVRDLVQEAMDASSGTGDAAELRHGGELLDVDLSERVSGLSCTMHCNVPNRGCVPLALWSCSRCSCGDAPCRGRRGWLKSRMLSVAWWVA